MKRDGFGLMILLSLTLHFSSALGEQASAAVTKDRAFTQFFRRTSGWTAGDGGLSVGLSAGGPWNFENTGNDFWARIKFPEMEPSAYLALPDFNGITFGNGLIKDGAHVLGFGVKRRGLASRGLASDIFVARFKSTKPESDW